MSSKISPDQMFSYKKQILKTKIAIIEYFHLHLRSLCLCVIARDMRYLLQRKLVKDTNATTESVNTDLYSMVVAFVSFIGYDYMYRVTC